MKQLRGISILLVLAIALAACSAAPASATTQPPAVAGSTTVAPPMTAAVSMTGIKFVPDALTVTVGTTVTWTNDDTVAHTVTADDGSFDSGMIAPGGTFSFTFNTAGTYPYKCTVHLPDMIGTITVTQ